MPKGVVPTTVWRESMVDKATCNEPGCDKPVHSRDKCQPHYRQMMRRNRPEGILKPGPKPDPTKFRSRHNPDNPTRKRPAKGREEKTQCPQGHTYDDENTYVDDKGYKHCKTCRRTRVASSRTPGRGQGTHNRIKTHCPKGHPYDTDNTITTPKGGRACRACARLNGATQNLKRYGLSPSLLEKMLTEQEWRCRICRVDFSPENKPHIDHAHGCCPPGKSCGLCVRGLLCRKCNHGLGNFNDDTALLEEARRYLIRYEQGLH